MRRRTRRGSAPPSFDSFLDVLTNTIGVLIVVLLFVTLSAADASILVRTPLRQETSKQVLFFEARGDRVLYVDSDKVLNDFERMRARLPSVDIYTLAYIRDRIEGFRTSTDNYRVRIDGILGYTDLSLVYTARPGAGEALGVLGDTSSRYRQVLSREEPDRRYVAFLVRPDGFEAFREARKHAWAQGYQVGWEPMESDREIALGGNGRQVGIQ